MIIAPKRRSREIATAEKESQCNEEQTKNVVVFLDALASPLRLGLASASLGKRAEARYLSLTARRARHLRMDILSKHYSTPAQFYRDALRPGVASLLGELVCTSSNENGPRDANRRRFFVEQMGFDTLPLPFPMFLL